MKITGNEPAYPSFQQHGLSIREVFAMAAMQGIISDQTYVRPNQGKEVALRAVELADALIDQLNKKPL